MILIDNIFGFEFIVADMRDAPIAHEFYDSLAKAEEEKELFGQHTVVVTIQEFVAKLRYHYLSKPLEEITEQQYLEKLYLLAPEGLKTKGDVESFIFAEFIVPTFKEQYLKSGNKYYRKVVDSADVSTHIDPYNIPTSTQLKAAALLEMFAAANG